MEPLVSILVPAYNAERTIVETLRSAVAQTWQRKEIIVVDDGSSDRTLALARLFESESTHVFHQQNQGAAAARNTAFSLSNGDFIQWLDADDLLSPDKIERQVRASNGLASERALFSCGWGYFIYRHYRAQFVPTKLWCDLSPSEWLLRKMAHNLHMQTATWLVSRHLTEAAGPWNTGLSSDDDGEYFCRVLMASTGTHFIPGGKVYYRQSPNSLSYIGYSSNKLEAMWRSMQQHVETLLSLEDSERSRAACVTYLQNWLVYLYPERMDIVEQARNLAEELGGKLQVPALSWKYSWIETLVGSRQLAKRAAVFLPKIKWSIVRSLDNALFRIENLRVAAPIQ